MCSQNVVYGQMYLQIKSIQQSRGVAFRIIEDTNSSETHLADPLNQTDTSTHRCSPGMTPVLGGGAILIIPYNSRAYLTQQVILSTIIKGTNPCMEVVGMTAYPCIQTTA